MSLYYTLAQHASDCKIFFRVWDDTTPSRLVLTGNPATSGFSCKSPTISLLTPSTYASATQFLSLEKKHSSAVLQESIIRHISLNHGEGEPPGMSEGDNSGLPNTDESPWISIVADLDHALLTIGRRLLQHPQRRQHLAIIRRADLVEKWTMVLPHIQAYQDRVPGRSAFNLHLKKCAKRARKESEYVIYGRIFLSSILFDLGWTYEIPGLDIPPDLLQRYASSFPPAWRKRELLPTLPKTPSTSTLNKSSSRTARKDRQRLRAEYAHKARAILDQKADKAIVGLGYGWADWMLDVIRRREVTAVSKVATVEMDLIQL